MGIGLDGDHQRPPLALGNGNLALQHRLVERLPINEDMLDRQRVAVRHRVMRIVDADRDFLAGLAGRPRR
ncbi:hypothetical protein D3C86_2045560 [compost metagenome]